MSRFLGTLKRKVLGLLVWIGAYAIGLLGWSVIVLLWSFWARGFGPPVGLALASGTFGLAITGGGRLIDWLRPSKDER